MTLFFFFFFFFFKEKNFIERLDSVKKLINIWPSRGLSIYGKVTIIKSFLIPKIVYACSVLPTPFFFFFFFFFFVNFLFINATQLLTLQYSTLL